MKILSEITGGTWLFKTDAPEQLKTLVNTVLAGGRINEETPELSTFLGEKQFDESTGETKLINKVAYIPMVGTMTKYSGMCVNGADKICVEAMKAQNDPDCIGTIFHIDGYGGNGDAIPLFQDIAPKLTKPRINLIDKALSAHYWAAILLGQYNMLSNDLTAEVGSVGAQYSWEKSTNEIIIVRPPESSEKNQDFINALAGDYSALEKKLSPLAQKFQSSVMNARPGIKIEHLKGATYYADEAIKFNLADSVGTINDAYNWVLAKSEIQKLKSK